jgi:predicted dithiol-disulfide oxidoreductase (DUF899 family)
MTQRPFPNESPKYRKARDRLLAAEIELRGHVERVAAQRRELPLGGAVRQNYAFVAVGGGTVSLAELFSPGKDTLVIYSFMYGPQMERPCPLCTSIIDGLNGNAEHIQQLVDVAVVARSPIERILEFAHGRRWDRLRFYSSATNSYNADYFGEDSEGNQWPMANVFVRKGDGIHHQWGSELLYAETPDWPGDARHVDLIWPLWNVLDLTPGGRPADWYPALEYDE